MAIDYQSSSAAKRALGWVLTYLLLTCQTVVLVLCPWRGIHVYVHGSIEEWHGSKAA